MMKKTYRKNLFTIGVVDLSSNSFNTPFIENDNNVNDSDIILIEFESEVIIASFLK